MTYMNCGISGKALRILHVGVAHLSVEMLHQRRRMREQN